MTTLRILEIFDSLQGEGYWTGIPMTFVRLSGCNAPELGLSCVAWCDTPAGWDPGAGDELEITEILRRVHLPRVCLTGGEPLLQGEVSGALVAELHKKGLRVHLETNGTVDPIVFDVAADGRGESAGAHGAAPGGAGAQRESAFDWVAVSPKPPGYFVASGWTGSIDELKLVVDEHLDAATAERLAAAHPGAMVFLQPEWGRYKESCERAVALVMDHPEWRLSLQTHKLLDIP